MSQRAVDKWARKFRILKDWKIRYDWRAEYKGQCSFGGDKTATIYAWGRLSPMPKDYFLHEVLHVAFRAFKATKGRHRCRQVEEELVQDLCGVWLRLLKT